MRIKLINNIWGFDNQIRFPIGQEFNVHPGISRFNVPVHEIADGPHLGVMIHKKDCVVIDTDSTKEA